MTSKKISYRFKILSYFLTTVFIVLLVVSTSIYFNIKSLVEEETIKNSKNTIVQLKNAVDIIFKQADMSLMQVAFDYNIENLDIRLKENGYQDIKYDLRRLNNLLSSNFYFRSAFVYYYETDSVADVTQVYPSIISMNSTQNYKYKNYIKQIVNSYKNETNRNIINFYNLNLNGEEMLTLVKPINPYISKPTAILIVTLNPNFFNDAMNSIKLSEKSDVFILDKKEKVISKMNKKIPVLLDLMNRNEKGNFQNIKSGWLFTKFDQEDYMISFDTSDLLGWKYVYTIPKSEIYEKITFVKRAVLLITFICAFFGIGISFLFAKRIYNPILQIKKNIKKYSVNQTSGNDDIEYIDQNVEYLITQNKNLEESLEESIPILKNSLLINVIKNKINFQDQLWDKLAFYNVNLYPSGYYCICILSIDQYDAFILNYQEKQLSLLEIYQKNIIHQICSSTNYLKCEIINFDINQLILILSTQENSKQCLMEIICQIHEAIIKNMKFTVTIGVGSICDKFDQISASYRDASTAQGYKIIKGNNHIIHIDDVPCYNNWEYIYPYDIEKNITYYLKHGNEAELTNSLSMYFEYAKKNINASTDIKYAFIHLLEITIKTTTELSINIQDFVSSDESLYQQLLLKETIFEAHSWFENLFYQIINYINAKRENKEETIFLSIKEYLNNNFTNPNISLEVVSEEFHFSVSYLGKLYKDIENTSIKEYITKKRIELAKELLENTNLKVKEISEQIGYISDRSFINIFKKYQNETPGEYRDRCVKKIL